MRFLPDKEKKKRKGLLAIKDKESEDVDDEEDGQAGKNKLKATVDEADVLFRLGKEPKQGSSCQKDRPNGHTAEVIEA